MSSSRGSEGIRRNTNEDDIEDDIEDDNEDSTEEQGGDPHTHDQHAAEEHEAQNEERVAHHPPGVCSRPHLLKRTTAQISKAI